MAYAGTIGLVPLGSGAYEIVVSETAEAALTSELSVRLPSLTFRIYSVTFRKVSGSATTLQPTLGNVTDPTHVENIALQVDEEAGPKSIAYATPICAHTAPDFSVFHRSKPNAGADNVIEVRYRIRLGWEG